MINYIWAFLILISILISIFTNKLDATVQAAFKGANDTITVILGFIGAMAMWSGIMKIAEQSGMVKLFSKAISPITNFLFPRIKNKESAMNAISMNMVANILGLSNAATPLGLQAMKELKYLNKTQDTASYEMCMFVVLNTASIQLIPSTLIAIRTSMGSKNPSEIILPIWIASFITAFTGCMMVKLFEKLSSNGIKKAKRR